MKKTGLAIPQPIVSSSSKWRRQPSGASSRVVERGAAVEVGDLQEDVMQHRAREAIRRRLLESVRQHPLGRLSRCGRPAEEADREEEAGDAPDRDDRQVAPADLGAAADGDVGVEEGLEEVADREEVGEVDAPRSGAGLRG